MAVTITNPTTAQEVREQEQEIILTRFTCEDAWQLGQLVYALAKEKGAKIASAIEKNGQIVFAVAFEGTKPDNDRFIAGKRLVVRQFHCSSLTMKLMLKERQKTPEEGLLLDAKQYSFLGGGVPISIKDVGVIGSLVVSGLPDDQDHALAVEAISALKDKFAI